MTVLAQYRCVADRRTKGVCDPAHYMMSAVLPCSPRFYTVQQRGPVSVVLPIAAASTPSWKI